MKNLSRTVLIFTLIFCSCITAFSADDKYVILDVEGEGANRNEAIEAAWLEGIRQAAGSFIDSKTELNDDKLTERIISYSRGLVEKYEIISKVTFCQFITSLNVLAHVCTDSKTMKKEKLETLSNFSLSVRKDLTGLSLILSTRIKKSWKR